MNPRFSFIVPIYNAERYLSVCLDSICTQTMPNFEAILIDDGSTDRSGQIADQYAAKDRRFIARHQGNRGTSGATNAAMRLVRGEYIINLDNDDYVTPNLLEDAARIIDSVHPDLIQYHAIFVDDDGHEKSRQSFLNNEFLFEGHESLKQCELKMPGAFNRTHSRKVIRTELAKSLPFVGTSKGADTSFLRRLLFHCEKVVLSPNHMFFVREVATSESRKRNPKFLYKEWFDRLISDLDYCISKNPSMHRKLPFFEFADTLDMFQMFAAKAINEDAFDSTYFKRLSKQLKLRKDYLFDRALMRRIKAFFWLTQTHRCAKHLAKRIPEGDFIV